MWDQREGKNVTVANIDMSQVTSALDSTSVMSLNGVLYVHYITPTQVTR
jgi:hypothetical protein